MEVLLKYTSICPCRLVLDISTRHVSAYVEHNSGVKVVEASTKEFSIARHLYKTCDVSAAHNIGRVLAHRMCQVGLTRVMWEDLYWTRKHMKVCGWVWVCRIACVGVSFGPCFSIKESQNVPNQHFNTNPQYYNIYFWGRVDCMLMSRVCAASIKCCIV